MFDMDARLLFEQTEQEALVNLNGYYATCEGLPGRIVRSEGEWPETQCWLIDLEGEAVAGPYQQLDAASWRDGEGRYIVSSFDTNTVTEAG